MESRIAQAIETQYPPIALLWSDEKPAGAMQFQEGKWGCVMWLAASAAKGRPAVCDAKTFGCFGGGVGMGFREQYRNIPGGEEGFCHFLSHGLNGWEAGPVGDHLLSFAMPFSLFMEMEANVEGSFLQRPTWQELLEAKRVSRRKE